MKEKDAVYAACTAKDIKVPTKDDTREYYFSGLMSGLFEIGDELGCLYDWLGTGVQPAEVEDMGDTPRELVEYILKDFAEMRKFVSAMRNEI